MDEMIALRSLFYIWYKLDAYLWANDPVSNELNKIIVSSKSQMNTRSTVLSTSSELPPFWLFLLVLQLLFPALIVPPLPELRFLESFFRAAIKISDYDYIYDILWFMAIYRYVHAQFYYLPYIKLVIMICFIILNKNLVFKLKLSKCHNPIKCNLSVLFSNKS